jgi:hypothetical protein
MPSLQLARGTCTRQLNIQRIQLLPLAGAMRIKVVYDKEYQARFDGGTPAIESSETPLLGERKGRVYVGIFAIL